MSKYRSKCFLKTCFDTLRSLFIHNNNLLQSHLCRRCCHIDRTEISYALYLFEGFAKLFICFIYYLGNAVSINDALQNTVEVKVSGTKSPVIYFKYNTWNTSLDASVCKGVSYVGKTMYRFSLKSKKDLNSQKTSTDLFPLKIIK